MTPGGIPAHFRRAVDDVPDKVWLLAGDDKYTYRAALTQVLKATASLRATGVAKGDRVVVTARNTAEYLFTWLALMELGAIQVPVNPKGTDDELAGFVAQVEPKLVVSDDNVAGLFVDEAAVDDAGPAHVEPGDLAVMIPTSGTTGRSKLVMQTHRAYVMAGEGFPWWLRLTSDDRLMTSLPLFHINAPAYSVLGSVAARASLVLLPAFSGSGFLDSARRYGATQCNALGAMVEILMRQPPRPDDAENPIRLCYTGPSPDRKRHLEIEARFGWELTCGYALSETPYGLIWPHGERPYGTLGRPRQHPTLGHVNDARVTAEGELELRNPAIMTGYYRMPKETAEVLVDGWLRTGDLVTRNGDGTYTFVGRKKHVIRRRGENLSPAEVEAVLERHPDVAEAAVIGVPSELSEEDVKAYVVTAPGTGRIDIPGLHAFVAEHLARFKVPRYFEVVGELPHTPTGRLAKHELPVERTPEEVDMDRPPASRIGASTADSITVAGRDLPAEVMGRLSLTQLAYLLLTKREPTAAETRLLDAVLVSLADHGLTPSALSARLTYTGAPEAPQAAVAAGLLGAGSVLLGPAGDTAALLAAAIHEVGRATTEAHLRAAAESVVATRVAAGLRIPGLGHAIHRDVDPRVPRLYELARELGLAGPHLRLLELVAEVHEQAAGRHLPINGAGAAGAALVDLGIAPASVRGFVLIGRTAGLVAHLAEEAEHPIGPSLWAEVEGRRPPTPPARSQRGVMP
ncbi:MAG: citryl-CoA lyase [Actinomycetota bacterium]|nr:citryl-CoA lyase [Actinomycetota bacterium]